MPYEEGEGDAYMPNTPSPDFAATLRRLRRDRGLTQAELAERARISVGAVSHLERGINRFPRKDTVQLLGTALGLSADERALLIQAARGARATGESVSLEAARDGSYTRQTRPLAMPLTPLIGREHDEAAVVHLLLRDTTRLLTLTGPAGIGKTRLALQVAATLGADLVQDVVFVELTAVQDRDRVLPAIARALNVRDRGDNSVRDALVQALRDRPVVIVLDNFEQVLPAARSLADLLSACPQVKALVTSRARLNVRGEQVFVVPPLELPSPRQMACGEDLEQFAAVALFIQRASAAQPGVTFATPDEGRMVAAICTCLDGLPLAIELAAARIHHLGLRVLHDRLTGPAFLRVLTGGPQDLSDHQRTMYSAIDWSYRLLAPEEQRLFRTLSVLVGGATLDSSQAVSGLDDEALLAGLSSLVDKSLLHWADVFGVPRYSQLVTLRAYGWERLEEHGELGEVRRRHADYFLNLSEQIVPGLVDQPREVMDRLTDEHENLRAAMLWALETGTIQHGLRMGGRLWKVWLAGSHMREGLCWLEQLLAHAPAPEGPVEQEIHALAWTGVLVFAHRLGRYQRAREAGEIALALRRAQGDAMKLAHALCNLGNPVKELRDYEHASALYEECMELCRAADDRPEMVTPLLNMGELKQKMGKLDEALALYEECIALSREVGETEYARALPFNNLGELYFLLDQPSEAYSILCESHRLYVEMRESYGAALSLRNLGRAEWRLGYTERAIARFDESAALCREMGDTIMLAHVLYHRASVWLATEQAVQATRDLAEAMDLFEQEQELIAIWRVVERCGTIACARMDGDSAVRLYAAASAHRAIGSDTMDPFEADVRTRDLAHLRAALGEVSFQSAVSAGQQMSLSDAIALARRQLR